MPIRAGASRTRPRRPSRPRRPHGGSAAAGRCASAPMANLTSANSAARAKYPVGRSSYSLARVHGFPYCEMRCGSPRWAPCPCRCAERPKSVITDSLRVDVKTVRKYVAPTEAAGMKPGRPPPSPTASKDNPTLHDPSHQVRSSGSVERLVYGNQRRVDPSDRWLLPEEFERIHGR